MMTYLTSVVCRTWQLCVPYLMSPCHVIHDLSVTSQLTRPLTWVSPVSVPASTAITRDHPSTWALTVSVPYYPNLRSSDPTVSLQTLLHVPLTLSSPHCFLKNFSSVAQICVSNASWCHHASLLWPPFSYPVSFAQTSIIGCRLICYSLSLPTCYRKGQ